MEGALEMPALGRPFQLGSLYDCRRDSLIPDVTLWDADLLQDWVVTEDRSGTDCRLLPSESLQSKAAALELKGSLKASFIAGLFEVGGGAAAYLEENPSTASDARGTLHLSVTTERKYLPTAVLPGESVHYFEETPATHVVTALLYGAQAFFVFDCGASESEDVRDVRRHLLEMIEKVPKVAAGGRDGPQWSDAERQMAGKIRSTVYADLPLKSPATFREALDLFAFSRQTFREGGKTIPVKVWLSPVVRFDPKAVRIVREPPSGWLREAEAHLQALIQVDLRCRDLIKSPVAALFPATKDHVEQLRGLCRQHGLAFRQEVGEALLAVREGREEPAALGAVLTCLLRSPFHQQALKKLLARKQQEMDFVKLCLSRLDGLEVVSAPDKLEEILFDGRNKMVVAFVLTSLHREEPSLDELRDWLHGPHSVAGEPSSKKRWSKLWFEDEERKCWIRCAVSSLSDFARSHPGKDAVRFLVSSVWDESRPGASVYLYENGRLVDRELELPCRPAPLTVELLDSETVRILAHPVSFGAGAVSWYQVEYRRAGEEWTSHPLRSLKVGIALDVQPNVAYEFRCAVVTRVGIGGWSGSTWLCPTQKPEKEAPLPPELGPRGHGGGEVPELRVILVGKTGDGKSATGNAILKRKHFASEMSLRTVTQNCQSGERQLKDRKIVVVDTPGVCDTQRSEGETSTELRNGLGLCSPGPHAIIHVLKVGTFTTEEKKTVRFLKSLLQAKALRYFILLFTWKEDLEGESLESFLEAQDQELKKYIAECGNRCLAFSNRAKGAEREAQVEELIRMVQDLVEKNEEVPYYSEETQKGSSWKFPLF